MRKNGLFEEADQAVNKDKANDHRYHKGHVGTHPAGNLQALAFIGFGHKLLPAPAVAANAEQAEDQSYLPLLKKRLTPLLRAFDCCVGISDPFHDIYLARPYYFQACAALENGQLFHPGEGFYAFLNYALRELLINAIGNLPMEMYYTEGMRRLKQHEEKSPVSYIETLRVYLDNNMSVTKATAKLFINRSTLIERLSRIKRELNCDLEDPDERLRIQILLKAEQLQQEIGRE